VHVILTGKLNPYPPRQMVNAEHEVQEGDEAQIHAGRIVPVYPLTAGLAQRFLRRTLFELAQTAAAKLADPLPESVRSRHRLLPLPDAVRALHIPSELAEAAAARRRLAFDEFFLFSLVVLQQRAARQAHPAGELDGHGRGAADAAPPAGRRGVREDDRGVLGRPDRGE
jgi:ATP-dependent DNA helicase RecG